MKRTFPLLVVAGMLMLGITACKEKKKSEDIIIAKYVPEGPKSPIRMDTDQRSKAVEWLGGSYSIVTSREAADSLPMLKDETGQEYIDNRVTITILRSDNTVFLKKQFTKNSFASYVDAGFRQTGMLENIIFHGVEDGRLKFGAVVSKPGSDDEFIPLDLCVDRQGGLTITQGKLFDDLTDEEEASN